MSILKNTPVFEFKEGDYSKPRHIIVAGSYEEIGFDLATIAKNEYGCQLGIYDDPIYARGRKSYMEQNWPEMAERSKGVSRAYGLSEQDVVFDSNTLAYDWYDAMKGGTSADLTTCSAALLPIEKSDGGVFVSRNYDMMAMVMWSEVFGKKAPEGSYRFAERYIVLETRPDKGYKSIQIGGNEVLHPYVDGINEKGLYVTVFHDPDSIGNEGTPTSGMKIAGLPLTQVPTLLLDTCASVEEAKLKILQNRVTQTMMRVHLLIADASGNGAVFELSDAGEYCFTDRKANEPLFVTNHELVKYPDPGAYPEFDIHAEHNTYARQLILRDAYAGLGAPFKKEDATAMTDSVHCSFVDSEKAEAGPLERTLSNCTCDLTKPELSVRWYLGDVKPVPGTNHMEDRMSDFYTFGFDDK
jgi:hypothetical protein